MQFVFDVETTGLPRRGAGFREIDAFDNARLLSISWIIVHNGVPIEQSYFLVRPEGFEISEESTRIHGISRKLAMEVGLSMHQVLKMADQALTRCRVLVAHNINFDKSILLSEFWRAGQQEAIDRVFNRAHVCTMLKGKDVMGVRKFPKLAELYRHLYNEDITNAHDAQYDTLYCYKCYVRLFPRDPDLFYFGEREVRLTAEQNLVVYEEHDKHVLVIACAGSGKSSTMLCRIKHLIESGVSEKSIIMMTFTRDAANDMRGKLYNIMGYKPNIRLGTIDSIAKYYTENLSGSSESLKHVGEYSHNFLEYLRGCGSSFFEPFKYIFVDEFQDINKTQYEIIKCFTDNGVILFAVGDDAQNIYTFRGSSVEYILNFHRYFGDCAIHRLNTNFRCCPDIVSMANASIEKNTNQAPKVMVPASFSDERPRKRPCVSSFSSLVLQNQKVVSLIQERLIEGTPEHQIAVLSPTNQTLYMIEELLTKAGVRHVLLEGKGDVRTRAMDGHVCLSTIHKSKGLEWDVVILINMSDSVIPKMKSEKAEEEDRRLFYVAMTRARYELQMLYVATPYDPFVTRYVSELEKSLFDSDGELVAGKSTHDTFSVEKSVDKLVSLLDGEDYIALRNASIVPVDGTPKKTILYTGYEISQQDTQGDFGLFVGCVITRMLSEALKKPCRSKPALRVLASVFLDNEELTVYRIYKNNFRLNVVAAVGNCGNTRAAKVLLEKGARPIQSEHVATVVHILREIRRGATQYNIPPDDVPVFNSRFIPEGFLARILKSNATYANMCVRWQDCIEEIWDVSKCERIVSEGRRRMLFKALRGADLLAGCEGLLADVETTFVPYVIGGCMDSQVFLHKPLLSTEGIFGEAFAVVGGVLFDVRTSSGDDFSAEWLVHLLCQKALLEKEENETSLSIRTIVVFNPLRGVLYTLDVSSWKRHDDLLQFLLSKREKTIGRS